MTVVSLIIRSSNDDTHYVLLAGEVKAIEQKRLHPTRKIPTDSDPLIDVAGAPTVTEQT